MKGVATCGFQQRYRVMIAEKLRTDSDVAQVVEISVEGVQVWSASHHGHDDFRGVICTIRCMA